MPLFGRGEPKEQEQFYCGNCGQERPGDPRICQHCGADQAVFQKQAQEEVLDRDFQPPGRYYIESFVMGMGVVRQEGPDVRNVQEALNRGDRNDWRLLSAAAGSSPTIKGSTIVGLMNEAAGVPIVLIWDTEPRSDQSGVAY